MPGQSRPLSRNTAAKRWQASLRRLARVPDSPSRREAGVGLASRSGDPHRILQRVNLTALLVDEYGTALSFFVEKLGFKLPEDTALTNDKRWRWLRRMVRRTDCYEREQLATGNVRRSAIKAAVACSCFSKQTTLPVTTSVTRSGASDLSKRLAMNHMAWWRSSKTSTETDGIDRTWRVQGMTFDPPLYAAKAMGGIERNDAPILAATARPGVPPAEAEGRRSLRRGRAGYPNAD